MVKLVDYNIHTGFRTVVINAFRIEVFEQDLLKLL